MKSLALTIRIPADLKQAIAEAAKADDRTVTSLIVKTMRAELDRRAQQTRPATAPRSR